MIKKLVFAMTLLAMALAIGAQTIDQYQVPFVGAIGEGGVKCPSIATNSRGDIMVVFRQKFQSIMYYFIKKSTGAVTQVKLPGSKYKDIIITSVVATADDNFHACWGEVYDTSGIGVYTADFNTTTETWSAPERIYTKYPEDSHLRVNPVNDDFALTVVLRQSNFAKDIYVIFRKSGQTAWGNEINLSTMPAAKSATNPYAHFDEAGYLHVVWKEDIGDDNLNIRVALIKKDSAGVYSMVDKKWATSNTGWQFLPSIAMTGTKGIITFCWSQQNAYYYLPYERNGDTVVVDPSKIVKFVSAPTVPWYTFHSKAIAHGDEIMFTYFDLAHNLQLLRYKDGVWLDTTPITLGAMNINKAPYQLWADPNLGLWASWFTESDKGDGNSYYCLYNYPKPSIRPPVNVTFARAMERSFFHGNWMFAIKWADNPYNIEKKITVVKFNIYRRIHWSSDKWLQVGSVAGTVFAFGDKSGVTATSDFEYAVTAVNEKNIESRIQEIGTVQTAKKAIAKLARSK
jgi:hypothetical protein